MDEDIQTLETEYCPPIDPALIPPIYSDYAGSPDQMQLARQLLDLLKAAALAEQTTEFDPSGSSGEAYRACNKQGSSEVDSNAESSVAQSTVTDATTLSNGLRTLSLGGRSGSSSEESVSGGYFEDGEEYDTPTKELKLAEMFPTLRFDFVVYTLKKCDNNYGRAIDGLLNEVYFEGSRASPREEVVIAKGIDAFAEEHHLPKRGRKGKGKKKNKTPPFSESSSASASQLDVSQAPPSNRWTDGSRDVDFIAMRTHTSRKTIASVYHSKGASLPATLKALIEKDIEAHRNEQEPDPAVLRGALDLNSDFPTMHLSDAIALIRLSSPSSASAHELAKALVSVPGASAGLRGGIEVIPKYAPISIPENASDAPIELPILAPSAVPQTSASLLAARSAAFEQASVAYRKGKSTPLMRSAAGYYSQVGRDINANLKAMTEMDADALVASQSSSTHLDLHGVSVNSATRIARERVQKWWDGLGEARIPGGGRRGVGDGYRIITGLGRHSEGGKGKIGPAVVRILAREGWKVEVFGGEIVVLGRVRK
ncbi:hypothetical protein BCR34DRAFT_594642 [Clohesyomyces aquaticus]|uniref:Smr domain-containing protein n=1 Tax=Clohesyomyces aquaticus TaxID=1231657 RepID=A0A1Y1Y6D8_9PLEO|nr:hypothetical protein BCR34DRAFT_594642 [Clohesyomyces aquaticus]